MSDTAFTQPFERGGDMEIHVDFGDVPSCPDENVLAEHVQGLHSVASSARLEQHLDTCEACRRTVSAVGQSSYVASRRTRVDSGRAAELVALSTSTLAQPAPTTPAPGTLLAGKYRVESVIGQGGMGIVLAATHLTLGKLVALKLMRPDLSLDSLASQRFVREARAASQLRSEHIARVIDLDTLDDGAPYIAMEYLEGEDLGAVLARRGTLPVRDAAVYIAQVCDAIAEAHASGIVHRDLKPANLFLTHRANTPCIKVLDFGVSKILAGGPLADDVANTDTRAIVGSPHYMAPEQLVSAKSVDPRTDIWALGCILFELVSGRSPFNIGAPLAQVMASILRDDALLTANVPAPFLAIVERCLQKDPAQRFQRVDDLAVALQPFTSATSTTTGDRAIATGAPATDRTRALDPERARTTSTSLVTRRRTLRSIVLQLVTAVVLVASVLFVIERSMDRDADLLAPAVSPPATTGSTPSPTPEATPVSLPATTRPTRSPTPEATPAPAAPPAPAATPSLVVDGARPASTLESTPSPIGETTQTSPVPARSNLLRSRVRSAKPRASARPKVGLEADLIGPSFD